VATAAVLLGSLSATGAQAHGGHPGKPPKPTPKPVAVRLISINDLHGNLEPPSGSSGMVTPDGGGAGIPAGGAAYIATHVKTLEAQVKNSVVLATGDSIGASPLVSALFHDEPTVDVLNELGVKATALGNHELDEGYDELLRLQRGGCHPVDGCQFEPTFEGMDFPVLGANVYLKRSGLPALRPFKVVRSGGQSIGVIGATLEDLPSVVVADGIKDLTFGDEVAAINRTSRLLDRMGVKTQVVSVHQGDTPTANTGPNGCNVTSGPGFDIAKNVSASVDAVFLAHSHQQYNCVVDDPKGNPRPVIQGASFGRLLSVVDLQIDPRTKDAIRSKTVAHNEIVTRTVTPDPTVQAIVDKAKVKSAPLANRQIGSITADLVRAAGPSGESPLGDVIADAQLKATTSAGAQIAITNPGGIRTDFVYKSSVAGEGDGVVTYGEAFTVQPFANIMQTLTMTGAQLDAVLEQQWQGTTTRVLQISTGFTYTMRPNAASGQRVSDLKLNDVPIDPAASYRVSVNNFLAGGGDGFTVFADAAAGGVTGGPIDLDALVAYFASDSPIAPPATNRITYVP
jgi:5'-nucleotidase